MLLKHQLQQDNGHSGPCRRQPDKRWGRLICSETCCQPSLKGSSCRRCERPSAGMRTEHASELRPRQRHHQRPRLCPWLTWLNWFTLTIEVMSIWSIISRGSGPGVLAGLKAHQHMGLLHCSSADLYKCTSSTGWSFRGLANIRRCGRC